METDPKQVTIHLGDLPVNLSREDARDLLYELERLMEDGDLDEPRIEKHTVETEAEMLSRQAAERMAAQLGVLIYKCTVESDPYLDLVA